MEAAHSTDFDPRLERISSALEELAENGSLGRLVRQTSAHWEGHDIGLIEDALQNTIARAYAGCDAEHGAESLYRWLERGLLELELPKAVRSAERAERARRRLAERDRMLEDVNSVEDAAAQGENAA